MKREDFKEVTAWHIKTCRTILTGGTIKCFYCPFFIDNSSNMKNCIENNYSSGRGISCFTDDKVIKSANDFLEMCRETGALIGEGTVAEDKVNSPKHYRLPGLNIESIDIIRAILGKYFKWFCLGNIIKYILRAEKKNGLEDYKKARKYLDWLIKGEEK